MNPVAQATGLFPLPTVLIVDSDPDTRELYSLMLADVAHDIQHADDGRIAMARVLAEPPNLVVTDAQIPFIDGYALCEVLRHDASTVRVPIVITTSDGSHTAVQRAKTAGANAVLVKPFLVDQFIAAIRGAVEEQSNPPHGRGAEQHDALELNGALRIVGGRDVRMKSHAHERYATVTPPRVPPPLRCPRCDRSLIYVNSHVGGVSEKHPEQWDHFECPSGCGRFDYRHRNRQLRRSLTP